MSGNRAKVLHILEAVMGGTRRHILQIADCIDRSKFDLSFVLSHSRNYEVAEETARQLRNNGFTVFFVEMRREIKPLPDATALLSLVRIMRRTKPSIVHTHSSKAGILGRIAANLSGVECCFHTPHLWSFAWENRFLKRNFFRIAEAFAASLTYEVLPVSKGQAREAVSAMVVHPARMYTIPNAVYPPPEDIVRKKTPEERQVIGAVGRLVEQKGYDILLRALKDLKDNGNELLLRIAGSGSEEQNLRNVAKNLGLNESVEFCGNIEEIYQFLAGLDVFVMPSLWEGLPYALLEAMSVPLPIVATDISGVNEMILNGWSGWLVPTESPDILADTVAEVITNPVEASRRAANAKKLVSEHTPQDYANRLEWRYSLALEDRV